MAVTAETRNDIIELVVTGWNSAPGTSLLTTLVGIVDDGGSVADVAAAITAGDTFKSIYPTFLTVEEFANDFLDNLVPSASEDARAEGVAAISFVLNSGGTRADVLLQAQTFLSSLSEEDPNFGEPAKAFNNKVEVATFHTVEQQRDASGLSSLQSVISGVTSDDDTVTAAQEAITSGGAGTGTTSFTLTDAIDTLTGTSGNDLVIGDNATASAADTLEMGDGTDTVRLFQTATLPSLNSVEKAEFYNLTNQDIDTSNASSLTSVLIKNSALTGDIDVNLANGEALTLDTISHAANQVLEVTSDNDDETIILNGVTGTSDLDLDPNGIVNLTLQGTGASSDIDLVDAGNDLESVTITGDQNIDLQNTAITSLVTIDASAATAGQTITIDAASDVTVTGSPENDGIDVAAATLDNDDSFDGGDGTDEFEISNAGTDNITAGSLSITNFETLRVNSDVTADVNYDMDNVTGFTSLVVGPNTAASSASNTITLTDITPELTTITFPGGGSLTEDLDLEFDGIIMDYDSSSDVEAVTVNVTNFGVDLDDVIIHDLQLGGVTNVTINIADIDDFSLETQLVIDDAESLVVNATSDTVDFVNIDASTDLESIDASGSTANLDFGTIDAVSSTEDVEITLGSGDDTIAYTGSVGITLDGGAGSDTIDLGTGANEITLGAGSDTLVADLDATNDDTITDFSAGQGGDVISGLTGVANATNATAFVTDSDGTGQELVDGFTAIGSTNNPTTLTTESDLATFLDTTGNHGGTAYTLDATNAVQYVAVDNGTDTVIFRAAAGTDATFGDATIIIVGVFEGVSDATTLTAANLANFLA
jgi:hypothetical protein